MRVRLPEWCLSRLLPWIGALIVRLIGASLRVEIHDPVGVFDQLKERPCLWGIWHNRLFLFSYIYFRYRAPYPCSVMVSQSQDGEIIALIIERLGMSPIRGSTSKGGIQVYRAALQALTRRRHDVTITPDGPRGPRYQVQPGIILLAQKSGCPIVPATYQSKWKIQFKSWDRFQIPIPFSRCDIYFHPPLEVPADASAQQIQELQKKLQEILGE